MDRQYSKLNPYKKNVNAILYQFRKRNEKINKVQNLAAHIYFKSYGLWLFNIFNFKIVTKCSSILFLNVYTLVKHNEIVR